MAISLRQRKSSGITEADLQRFPMQMYHYLAIKAPVEGKVLLEVGSGRGGGARYIAADAETGILYRNGHAGNAVRLANKMHVVPNLRFIQGSAEAIPLPDNSVDVVLNVESCHGYGSVPTVFVGSKAGAEARRSLVARGLQKFSGQHEDLNRAAERIGSGVC